MRDMVECHSGYAYAERPVKFYWQGEYLEVKSIEASWRTPAERFFRVRSQDERIFELNYNEIEDEWKIKEV
jgi:hypothetical protein